MNHIKPLNRSLWWRTALAACSLTTSAMAQVELELPRGGWRNSTGEANSFLQEIRYPAVAVNAAGQKATALVRGHILAHKNDKPGKLIINGVAMPLLVDESGRFERPYSFGNGSNNIEVRSSDGRAVKRAQFYDANAGRAAARLRVVLSWDSPGTDLDLHVVSPDGDHVFWAGRVGAHGGALDVDVTTGFGPEIYANPAPPKGVYHVYVNYWGGNSEQQIITMAQVSVVSQEGTLSEKRQVFQVPLRRAGELLLIKSFNYP
ncbi:MAG: hypothetical protein RL748_1591 [Pseudomonadota bacterium]